MHMIIKRLTKWLVRAISVFLPEEKAHDLQRWRRGREEFWKYNHCQYIFASYGTVSYTHLTLPTNVSMCRSRWSPYH